MEELGLTDRVTCLWSRAEDAAHRPGLREQFDFAVARAVAPMPVLAEYLLPFARVGGAMLAWKGPSPEEELAASRSAFARLGGALKAQAGYRLPEGEHDMNLIWVNKIRPTPAAYPRKAGTPGKNPL